MIAAKTTEQSKRVKVLNRKLVPLHRLKNAKHNPANRILKKNIRALADSLDMIGQLCPVAITPEEEIIDGHRRVAAAKLLGWQDIECVIVEEDPATVYASVNATPRKMGGNDALVVWLENPVAVTTSLAMKFAAMNEMVGRPVVKQIAAAGLSYRVYETAKRICRYCDDKTRDTLKAVIKWLLETATIGQVQKAMEAGQDPGVIMQAVQKNKPVVFRLAVSE
jgi:hypothetical protein